MKAYVFPAGDPDERHRIAVHRLVDADPPRHWSVDVNRQKVAAGDVAFLWQTGQRDDPWRPGLWAAGVVYHFNKVLDQHWRDPSLETMYADLELEWVPIVDRELVRADAQANGAMRDCVLVLAQRVRSPLLLRDTERDWLLAQIPSRTRSWISKMRQRALGNTE